MSALSLVGSVVNIASLCDHHNMPPTLRSKSSDVVERQYV
jgi:hypothetical protein